MIYLFLGESYFRKKLIESWKAAFKKKYSEYNIIHVSDVFDHDLSFYEQNLLSSGFFGEKNLFIIDDFPFGSGEHLEAKKIQDYFLSILPKVNNENVIVFNNSKVDKESQLYKEIEKIGNIKDFSINSESELISKLSEIYSGKVSQDAIKKMVELKGLNFGSIALELDKILITRDFVDVSDLEFVTKDVEENIFEVINSILSSDVKATILKLRNLFNFLGDPYLAYTSLASNLRPYFYIFKLKLLGKSPTEIKDILNLGNRALLAQKDYKIDESKFMDIYKKIISIDGRIKTGKLIGNEAKDILYELEKSLIISLISE